MFVNTASKTPAQVQHYIYEYYLQNYSEAQAKDCIYGYCLQYLGSG
jgi:hypothetical protein